MWMNCVYYIIKSSNIESKSGQKVTVVVIIMMTILNCFPRELNQHPLAKLCGNCIHVLENQHQFCQSGIDRRHLEQALPPSSPGT